MCLVVGTKYSTSNFHLLERKNVCTECAKCNSLANCAYVRDWFDISEKQLESLPKLKIWTRDSYGSNRQSMTVCSLWMLQKESKRKEDPNMKKLQNKVLLVPGHYGLFGHFRSLSEPDFGLLDVGQDFSDIDGTERIKRAHIGNVDMILVEGGTKFTRMTRLQPGFEEETAKCSSCEKNLAKESFSSSSRRYFH